MPKIIENLPHKLAEEARRQIEESGFSAMTVRSVAKGCGVGVGTVYNYFPSKEALVATFMLDDWNSCVAYIQQCSEHADTLEPVLSAIHSNLRLFMEKFGSIFQDEGAMASFAGSSARYHSLLRSHAQLAELHHRRRVGERLAVCSRAIFVEPFE